MWGNLQNSPFLHLLCAKKAQGGGVPSFHPPAAALDPGAHGLGPPEKEGFFPWNGFWKPLLLSRRGLKPDEGGGGIIPFGGD